MKTFANLRRICLLSFTLLFSIAKAEEFDVQLTPTLYAGGYNISCHGANNGAINLFISGGVAPYTFVWLDGPTVRNRSNLAAGYYRVVVTGSNGISLTREITLTQPNAFQALLYPTEYEGGYHISENGGNNGIILSEVIGGVPPYSYLWSNGGSTTTRISDLIAGAYSLTMHDATNCVTTATVTLIEPTVFQLVSIVSPTVIGSYNIGCNLLGSINVTVAGGTPPYTYQWEHGPTTQNVSDLTEAQTYNVHVHDDNGAEIQASIELTHAPEVTANATAFVFPNTKNTSCNSCTNGSITLTHTSGTSPYTYEWNNGSTVKNPNNLGAGMYSVVITDAAGCATEKTVMLAAPEREDWTMNGNAGISASQFIGTTDSSSAIFKANNSEILKLVPDLNGGYARFSKLISAEAGIALNASKTLKISSNSTNTEESVYFGKVNANLPSCIVPPITVGIDPKYLFDGFIHSRPANPVGSTNAALILGSAPWNGTGVIEVEGTDDNGGTSNGLLVNYFCGRDVAICANPAAGGVVSTGYNFEVGYPFPRNLGIASNIRGESKIGLRVETVTANGGNASTINTQLSVFDSGTKIIAGLLQNSNNDKEIFSINGDGETRIGSNVTWTKPTLYITPSFASNAYIQGMIGIGTDNPQATLDVDGGVRISGLNNNLGVIKLVQADEDGDLSTVSTTTLSGLGLWQTNGPNIYRQTGRVGIGISSPSALLEIEAPIGEQGLKVTTLTDPFYNVQLISSATSTKIIGGFLNNNNLTNEVFSIKSDGKTIFGNPIRPSLFINTFMNQDNSYSVGKVGIGTNTPIGQLQVGEGVTSVSIGDFFNGKAPWTTNYIGFNAGREVIAGAAAPNPLGGLWTLKGDVELPNAASIISGSLGGDLQFIAIGKDAATPEQDVYKNDDEILNHVKMTIRHNGIVSIGTGLNTYLDPNNGYKLYVTGGIRTEKVKVDIAGNNGWADYVFDKTYKKMPLNELENYIAKNKHLPDMPSACEAQENGVDLLEMQVKLLKSLEELTLHMIDLKKENELLKVEIEKLK